jgi:hypothetical protein
MIRLLIFGWQPFFLEPLMVFTFASLSQVANVVIREWSHVLKPLGPVRLR